MRFLNFGSLNLDHTYRVSHIVAPGETIASSSMSVFPGGKGLNQSIALARAGACVYHAGMIGEDGMLLMTTCSENGVNTDYIKTIAEPTGNAFIQVSDSGENCIVLFGGANRCNTREHIQEVLSHFEVGDVLLLQNEINLVDVLIEEASKKGMTIVLNPSPYNESIASCDLEKVHIFMINEVEGQQITGEHSPQKILAAMAKRYPRSATVLTLGSKGVMFCKDGEITSQDSCKVNAVDTTAAGDVFTGYFIKTYFEAKHSVSDALKVATKAAALAVMREGAVPSIPWKREVED